MKTSEKLEILSALFKAQENYLVIQRRFVGKETWSDVSLTLDDVDYILRYMPDVFEYRIGQTSEKGESNGTKSNT